ncbi:MAG: response regulator transcription factor [Treponema sp.]|jgi:two-component system response regulator RegX3|nr:response regulator transcription factor [Treponema sp.]
MKGNVLIVEDITDLADVVSRYLVKEGFEVRAVTSAEDAFSLLEKWLCNLIILDINLPGMDGFEFLTRYKKTRDTPVLIMSARTSEEDQITGLGIGADEYITKPFSPRVLTARVRSLFRRMEGLANSETKRIIVFGPYMIDMDTRKLKKGDTSIELSAKEYALLSFLAENAEKPMSPEMIYEKVWEGLYGDLTTVAVHIQRLRKKIEDDPANPAWIVTARGMGYKLNRSTVQEALPQ